MNTYDLEENEFILYMEESVENLQKIQEVMNHAMSKMQLPRMKLTMDDYLGNFKVIDMETMHIFRMTTKDLKTRAKFSVKVLTDVVFEITEVGSDPMPCRFRFGK